MKLPRSSHSSSASSPGTPDAARDSRSLEQLLQWVLLPSASRADVDALLRGFARPLGAGETPRARADFLLEVLESSQVTGMMGSTGQGVHAAALEALLKLGAPYAVEISPEALVRARGKSRVTKRELPVIGLLLVLAGAIFTLATVPMYVLLVLIPSAPTILGGWLRIRGLQRAGLVLMGLLTVALLMLAAYTYQPVSNSLMFPGLGNAFAMLLSGAALFMSSCAFLLRRPWWRVEE